MEENYQPADLRLIVRGALEEFLKAEQAKAEPVLKAELVDEKRRREQLEQRVNELVQENQRNRQIAEEAERSSHIRSELQRLGVAKVDLAYRVVRDDIQRGEDGRLVAKTEQGDAPVRDYLAKFVNENPELLPARISGGSGVSAAEKSSPAGSGFDLDKIRPGMSSDDLERVRQEVARLMGQPTRS